jgi:hypothetical protein
VLGETAPPWRLIFPLLVSITTSGVLGGVSGGISGDVLASDDGVDNVDVEFVSLPLSVTGIVGCVQKNSRLSDGLRLIDDAEVDGELTCWEADGISDETCDGRDEVEAISVDVDGSARDLL